MKIISLFLVVLLVQANASTELESQSTNSLLVSLIAEGNLNDRLGYSLAVDGNTALISSENEVVKVFKFDGENWVFSQNLGNLAYSISLSDDMAFLGDPYSNKVYVYQNINNNWQKIQEFQETDPDPGGQGLFRFGWSVSVSEDYAVIGTNSERAMPLGGSDPRNGYAYIYHNIEGVWNRVQTLPSESGSSLKSFGINVEIENDKLLITSKYHFTGGKVHSYLLENDNWSSNGELIASESSTAFGFGSHVEISGNQAVISSWNDSRGSYQYGILEGSAYVFRLENQIWTEKTKLEISNLRDIFYGFDVQINGDTILISEINPEDSSGTIYVFNKLSENSWLNTQMITRLEEETFGWVLGISDNQVIAGSPVDFSPNNFSYPGAAYSFTIDLNPDLDPLFNNGFE